MNPRLPDAFLRRPIAHRALHDRGAGRIENSPAAIDAAIAAGYGIEIDLQLSADGQAMVFHDDHLDRLTAEAGPVRARSAEALTQIPLRGTSDTVPTLASVLAQVAGRVPLLIELKDQDGGMGPAVGALEEATLAAVADYAGPFALMSFNPHSVACLAKAAPDVPRGLTTSAYDPAVWALSAETCTRLRSIPDAGRVGASFISHEAADLRRPRVAELQAEGLDVLCWTIRSPEAEAEARKVAQNVTFEGYLPALDG